MTADVICHHCAVLQVFQQELDSRQSMVAAMRSSPTSDPAVATQLDELTSVWDRVNQLCQVREARLQEALKLVSHFFKCKVLCVVLRTGYCAIKELTFTYL